ncbi:hypothetical protein F4780DRAFT_166300 [Xylariomycetidae sp. FL0641]|nr:hypothetical protein F4780DRAFT_166300 [Xylariomycetidae sp. FL0641]
MDAYNVLVKVYQCGHEVIVPVFKDNWKPSFEEPVHYIGKCDTCTFPKLLERFRLFNNVHLEFKLGTATLLAYELFEAKHCLSSENVDQLMRHWMRGISQHILEEGKQKALYEGLVQSVAEKDGPLAGKEMKALLGSGHIRFIKKGRGYSRPIGRRSTLAPLRVATLSRPSTASPSSPSFGAASRLGKSGSPFVTSPTSPTGVHGRVSADEHFGLDHEEEDHTNLHHALERLHNLMQATGLTEHWGNPQAESQSIHSFCDDLEREKLGLERAKALKKKTGLKK